MPQDHGYLEVSQTEIESGIAFARKGGKKNRDGKQKYPPMELNADRLGSVANRTLKLMAEGMKFLAARNSVLNGEFRERTKHGQELRNAYAATVSHILGKRSGYAKKARIAPKKKPSQSFAANLQGQLQLYLPSRAGH